MKKMTTEILNLDVKKLIDILNAALAEEWLAYYQYWVGARLMEGPMRTEIETELLVHADEELGHAVRVIDRIIQLGGTPVLDPEQWKKVAACVYEAPTDPYIEVILAQNLTGERCAIKRYQELAEFTAGKDLVTNKMAIEILTDELEHENDIMDWQTDIAVMKESLKRILK